MIHKILLLIFMVVLSGQASAAILWVGGEDVDFPNGNAFGTNTGATFRTGFARLSLAPPFDGAVAYSNPFPGGSVTSAWLSARVFFNVGVNANKRLVGLGKSGTSNAIFIGLDASSKLALFKWNGTSLTLLASEATGSINGSGTMYKFDLEVVNYGAAGTLRVYVNGSSTARVTYTGDITIGGTTNLDDVRISGQVVCCAGTTNYISELLVADTDTRLMSVLTLAPNAAGTTNQWTGAHTDVNETTTNDSNLITSSTSGQDFQCNVTDLPAGSFDVEAVKIFARAAKSGTGIGGLSIGLFTNSSVHSPAAASLQGAYTPMETYFSTNPVTSSPWTSTELNALQFNLRSAP